MRSQFDYKALHRKEWIKDTLLDTVTKVCIVISIASVFTFLENETYKKYIYPSIVVGSAVILFLWYLYRDAPQAKTSYKDKNTDIRVIVECCDILAQPGLKVIHTVDTFDMELHRIITPRSLHGAFLEMCMQKNADIDAMIDDALLHHKPIATDETLPGRKNRYALGTICLTPVEGEHFCCAAFARLLSNGSIEVTRSEYIEFLTNLWENLAEPRIREDVINVAVMGNRFADLPAEFSTEQKVDLMIQTFFMVARKKSSCRTLHICVHPNDAPQIDFRHYSTIIEHLAKRPVL